ncbi:MAG: hypothetical protein K2X91_05870 [Thermoleophilia bacterium]|jgi:hypothetical protein|nr:hypothetical protein [Thermoleophilia bacterium]
MRILAASLALGVMLTVPDGSMAQGAGATAPPAQAPDAYAPDIYFAYVPPRLDGSAFVPQKAEATGSLPAPVVRRPPETQTLPNQRLSGLKGQKVVRDICIGCGP